MEKFDHLLTSLGPDAILDRGYAIVTRAGTTEIISDPNVISKGQLLDVVVAKGKFEVEVGKIASQELRQWKNLRSQHHLTLKQHLQN